MKILDRFSALLLSVLLILTAVFIPTAVVAANNEADPEESLLYGIAASYNAYNDNGVMFDSNDNTLVKLTDGDINSLHSDYYSAHGKQFIWMLNERATIDKVALWERTSTDREGTYEIYIGSNSADLFAAENLVYTFAPNGKAYKEFTLGYPKTGVMVGVKVTDASEIDGDNCARIREFAVYGTAAPEESVNTYVNKYLILAQQASTHKDNLIAGKTPVSITKKSNGANASVDASHPITNLTDGSYTTQYDATKTDITGASYGDTYYVTYELDKIYDINAYSVYSAHKGRGSDYCLYVGNDIDTLYAGTPISGSSTYSATDGYNFGTRVQASKGAVKSGKYVGFAFTPNNTEADSRLRLKELQVFGKVSTGSATMRPAMQTDAKTTSLIYGRGIELASIDKNTAGVEWSYANTSSGNFVYGNSSGWLNSSNLPKITDGTVSTAHGDICNVSSSKPSKVIWALDKTYDITSFLLYNSVSTKAATAYEVYAADKLTELFNAENMIYSYGLRDGSGNLIESKITKENGQYVEFTGDKIKSANFVAVWFRENFWNSTNPDSTARISEIAFYGTESQNSVANDKFYSAERADESSYANIAAKLDDATFTADASILKNATLSVKNASGTAVTTPANAANLINGNVSETSATELYGNYLNYEFTYDLGGDATVKGFMHSKNNLGFTEGYKVYVGADKDTLYTDANLVLDMSNIAVLPRIKTLAVKFATAKQGQYLGIKWTGVSTDSAIRIAELAAWGEVTGLKATVSDVTDQIIADNSSKNLITSKIPTYWYNDADGNFANHTSTILPSGASGIDKLTDNSLAAHADVYGGNGKRIVYDLGGYKEVEAVLTAARNAGEEISYKIYIADTLGALFTKDSLKYTYNADYSAKGQYIKFDNAVKGYYAAIELTNIGSATDYARLQEIAFYGKTATGGAESAIDSINANFYRSSGSPFAYSTAYAYEDSRIKGLTVTDGTVITNSPGNRRDNFGDNAFDEIELWDAWKTDKDTVTFVLKKRTNVSALQYWSANKENALRDSYDVYVGDDMSTLYNDNNKVFSWDAKLCAISVSQRVTFKSGKEPVGSYVGIKYTDSHIGGDSGARASEFAVWGTDAPAVNSVSYNLSNSDAETMYSSNILAGLEASWLGGGSTNGDQKWSKAITDGYAGDYTYNNGSSQVTQKHHDIYEKNGMLELVYALEYEHNVEEIAMWQPHHLKNGFDVYVGNSTKDLFSSENKVSSWSYLSNPDANSIYITLSEEYQKRGKYIGIKFTDHEYATSGSARVSEIYVGGTQTSWDNSGINTAVSNSDIAKLYENNLLTGRLPALISNPDENDGKNIQGNAMTGMLSDGDARECEIYNAHNTKMYFDLGCPTTLSQIGLWMTNQSHRVSYKVYVGNDTETLFDGTPVYIWDALADPSSMAQLYKFNSNAPITARYVGFHITDASSAHEENASGWEEIDNTEARIAELYVGGVQDMSAIPHETLDNLDGIEGENLLSGFVPTLDGTAVSENVAAALTDKAAGTGAGVVVSAGSKIVYNIERSANFEDIIISSDKTLGRYEVYVSDSIDNLFKNINCVYTAINTENNSNIIKISNPQKNRLLLGIRVIDPAFDDSNSTVINEIVLTGAFNKYTTTYPQSSIATTEYGDSNLLEGLTPILKKLDGRDVIKTSSSASPLFTGKFNVTDENGNPAKWGPGGTLYHWWTDDRVGRGSYHPQVGDHVDVWGSGDGLTITYQLSSQDKFNISAIALYNHRELYLGAYEVYVSNNESTLYSPENKVIDFVNENQSWAQVMSFASDSIPVGKYVGFRFETSNYTGEGSLRLSEIVVLGTKYDPKPTNLAITAGVKGYVENNGVYKELDHSEFSTAQKKNFINDANHDALSIDKQSGKLHFVIDLNAPMVIDTFRLENVAASNKRVKSFKVYVANFPDEVWQDSAYAFTYNKTASDAQTVLINRKLEGRYIRIEVLDNGASDGSFNLNHIALIGMDNQSLDVSNHLYGINTSNISYYAQDNKTYEYESLFSTYKLSYLCDNSTAIATSIWGASRGENGEGEQSTNLVFNFTNAKSLSEIQVSSLIDKVYAIDDMEIYLGNSLNAVMDKSAQPIAIYNTNGNVENASRKDDGNDLTETTYFNFENTEALYVRIRINDSVDEVHGGSTKLIVLAEVKANGVDTANASINADGEFSAQFTDSKTGISASFSKLGVSDVYRGVTRMVVSRQKVTKAMSDALAKTGFEIYGDAYAVEFYDYLGNRVTDFGGRTVKFTVPFPSELGMAYLAGYYYEEFNLLNSGFEESNIAYVYPELTPNTVFALAIMSDLVSEDITPLPTPDEEDTIIEDTVITPDDDYDDDEIIDTDADADDDEEEVENKPQKKKRKKRIKKIVSGMSMTTIIIIIAACVVAAAAIAAAVIVIIRKKRVLKN